MAILLGQDGKIDATNPDNLSDKVLGERETRKRLLSHARLVGCEKDMLLIFNKIDTMMRTCGNDQERADIGKLGAAEIYTLLGRGGKLYVNGRLVFDDEPNKNTSPAGLYVGNQQRKR